jgi:hypothetical protein
LKIATKEARDQTAAWPFGANIAMHELGRRETIASGNEEKVGEDKKCQE